MSIPTYQWVGNSYLIYSASRVAQAPQLHGARFSEPEVREPSLLQLKKADGSQINYEVLNKSNACKVFLSFFCASIVDLSKAANMKKKEYRGIPTTTKNQGFFL